MRKYLVKNINRTPVQLPDGRQGDVYPYFTKYSKDHRRFLPVAYGYEHAVHVAVAFGYAPDDAVVSVPDNTVVMLDDSARQLPHTDVRGTLKTETHEPRPM